jgi:hypothetical protein
MRELPIDFKHVLLCLTVVDNPAISVSAQPNRHRNAKKAKQLTNSSTAETGIPPALCLLKQPPAAGSSILPAGLLTTQCNTLTFVITTDILQNYNAPCSRSS